MTANQLHEAHALHELGLTAYKIIQFMRLRVALPTLSTILSTKRVQDHAQARNEVVECIRSGHDNPGDYLRSVV